MGMDECNDQKYQLGSLQTSRYKRGVWTAAIPINGIQSSTHSLVPLPITTHHHATPSGAAYPLS